MPNTRLNEYGVSVYSAFLLIQCCSGIWTCTVVLLMTSFLIRKTWWAYPTVHPNWIVKVCLRSFFITGFLGILAFREMWWSHCFQWILTQMKTSWQLNQISNFDMENIKTKTMRTILIVFIHCWKDILDGMMRLYGIQESQGKDSRANLETGSEMEKHGGTLLAGFLWGLDF